MQVDRHVERVDAIEGCRWSAANRRRGKWKYGSDEYFLPVMGLVFLGRAYRRYLAVKDKSAGALPMGGGWAWVLTKEDFSQKNAIFLWPEADSPAMESIEADSDSLRGVLPKGDCQALDDDILGDLLCKLKPEELKQISGDLFGRIWEYSLTMCAQTSRAHDDGEFFTRVSLVSLIVDVLDFDCGTVLGLACGSANRFIQGARKEEEHGGSSTERLTLRCVGKGAAA